MGVTLLVLSVGMIPELWKAWSDVLRCRTDGYGAQPLEFSRIFGRAVSRDAPQADFEQLYMWNVLDICSQCIQDTTSKLSSGTHAHIMYLAIYIP